MLSILTCSLINIEDIHIGETSYIIIPMLSILTWSLINIEDIHIGETSYIIIPNAVDSHL